MDIRRNTIVWADLKNQKGHIQSGRRPCMIVSCDIANKHAPVYTVIPGTTQMEKADFPVHFTVHPKDVKGALKWPTVFLTEQMTTIDKDQIIQIAGYVSNEDIIRTANEMIVRQLELGGKANA